MQGTLKVTSEELGIAALDFFSESQHVRTCTNAMMELVDGMGSIWTGEAQNAYAAKFHTLDDDIARILRMINEHMKDLNEMSWIYDEAEKDGVELIQSLASDVIQ